MPAPSLNLFLARSVFNLFNKYKPETAKEKRARLTSTAQTSAQEGGAGKGAGAKRTNNYLRFGLNNVTGLVEKGAAKLVLIAHDVDPIELVIWLPQLCRKKNVPYMIVKGKAKLGQLVHKKTATCVAICDVNDDNKGVFNKLTKSALANFNNNGDLSSYKDSTPVLGHKSRLAEEKRQQVLDKEIEANS